MPSVEHKATTRHDYTKPHYEEKHPLRALLDIARTEPNRVIVTLAHKTKPDSLDHLRWEDMTAAQFVAKVKKLATYLHTHHGIPIATKPSEQQVISLFGPTPVEWLCYLFASAYLGHVGMAVSTRNSAEAVVNLLKLKKSKYIVVWPVQAKMVPLLQQDVPDLDAITGVQDWTVVDSIKVTIPEDSLLYAANESLELPFLIYHSSGSTGFPKPIPWTGRTVFNFVRGMARIAPGEQDYTHNIVFAPLFHAMGSLLFFMTLWQGKSFLFPPASEPLNGTLFLEILKQSPPLQLVLGVPSIVKEIFETENGIAALRRPQELIVGGAPMPSDIGDAMVTEGIQLENGWGSTEVGGLGRGYPGKYWEWLELNPEFPWIMEEQEGSKGVCEMIVKSNDFYKPNVSNRPDGSYATSDLWIQHPTEKGFWKILGRLDDTLVLVNGEKTNPLPIEGQVMNSPLVQFATVFGHKKPHNGIIIQPSAAAYANYPDKEAREAEIWKVVQSANKPAPQHSQIQKSMIYFPPEGTKWPQVDKGSVSRKKVYKQFDEEIEQLYADLENSGKTDINLFDKDEPKTKAYVRSLVVTALDIQDGMIQDKDNLFDFGMDSLQVTKVRNGLLGALKTPGDRNRTSIVPPNLVYQQNSISKLTRYIYATTHGVEVQTDLSHEQAINAMITKYHKFVDHVSKPEQVVDSSNARYVILTGATGSLGNYLLLAYLAMKDVKCVYALNRQQHGIAPIDRLKATFRDRFLDTAVIDKAIANGRLHVLNSSLGEQDLGIGSQKFEEIRRRVTLIVHNAWSVNFNKDMESFERDCIQGSLHLINLCLASPRSQPAAFHFTTTIAAAGAWDNGAVPERPITDARYVNPMGYAQSKFVVERLCALAAAEKGLPAIVYRVGQMVGSTHEGAWNFTEHLPLLFAFAVKAHVLPKTMGDDNTWIPVDIAADTIRDVSEHPQKNGEMEFYHVLNPHATTWKDIANALCQNGVNFEMVEPSAWLEVLRHSDPDPGVNPTIKLLSFYEGAFSSKDFMPSFETKETVKASASLKHLQPVDSRLIGTFLQYWQKRGYIDLLGERKVSR